MFLKIIMSMLALVTSTKTSLTKLQEAITVYFATEGESEKHLAKLKVLAFLMLVTEKLQKELKDGDTNIIMKTLAEFTETQKEASEEEKKELSMELAQRIINETSEDEDEDNEFHVHDCDSCHGKGQCPIESIMRDVKSGKITPQEGEKQADAMLQSENIVIPVAEA